MPDTSSKTHKYEAVVFNQVVRDLLAEDKHHHYLYDTWAENRYVEIAAEDEEHPRAALERHYPQNIGFVVSEIIEMPEDEE